MNLRGLMKKAGAEGIYLIGKMKNLSREAY